MNNIYLLIALLLLCHPANLNPQVVQFEEHMVDNFQSPAGIFLFDIDGDSMNDIVAAGWNSNEIAWWHNEVNTSQEWTKYIVDNEFPGAAYVVAGDIDGDSLTDIVGAGWDGNQVAWWKNTGGNPVVWIKNIVDSNFRHAHEVFLCDMDYDDDLDILGAAALDHALAWWRNDGGEPIQWSKQVISSNFYGARSVCAGDIDGDNDMDVVGAALISNEIAWWRNDCGNPILWIKQSISSNFLAAHKVTLYDLDKDNDPDILGTAYTSNEIAWWRNDGGNPYSWTKISVTNNFYGAVIAYPSDIDKDNDADVIGSAQGSNQVAWWSNENGSPVVWDKHQIRSGYSGAWPMHIGDIDGDTDIDVVVGGFTANQVKWWENSFYSANFLADSTSGEVPFLVQFTDLSSFSQPVNSWEWDFNNDGYTDSYDQNPSWIYTEPGTYSVKLKVSSGQSSDTEIKLNYINALIVNAEEKNIPYKFQLYQNNPNPFNPSTTIRYDLPEGSKAVIRIYDLLGREIIKLIDEFQPAGSHIVIWDGKNEKGMSVNSGIYLYSLTYNNFSITKKMLLLK